MRPTSSWRITSAAVKAHMADALDAGEQAHRLGQAGGLAGRQVDLARIAGDDHAAVLAQPGEEHLHLHRGGVLRLVEDDHRIGQRAAAHEGERRDLDLAGLQRALDDAGIHQVAQRVVDRAQIGIDLLAHVAGQEAEPLAGLDGGARQDDAVDLLALEQRDRVGDREPGLAGAGRPGAEHQRVAAQRPDIGVLRRRARAHRPLAQVDLLEALARARRIEVEQRALRDGEPDRALDVAGDDLVAALEPVVQAFEHAARLLAGVARALDGDVVAARVGGDAEPPLDQREVLAVLAEQHRGQPVVVEGEHDLGGAGLAVAAEAGMSEPLSDPRVRNASALQGRERGCGGAAWHGARQLAEQAVGAGARDRDRDHLADQRRRAPSPAPAADRASGRPAGRAGGPASRAARRGCGRRSAR